MIISNQGLCIGKFQLKHIVFHWPLLLEFYKLVAILFVDSLVSIEFFIQICILYLKKDGIHLKTFVLPFSQYTGPRFNIKMTSYQYRKSHCGDKTILRPSYLYNGISYTGKMTSLYWIRALVLLNYSLQREVTALKEIKMTTSDRVNWGKYAMFVSCSVHYSTLCPNWTGFNSWHWILLKIIKITTAFCIL